jgi:urease accessory protein
VDLDGSGVATLLLLNPTGGVVGGDVLETSVLLQAGSRVCLSTPAATRIYRSTGAPAVQRFSATLGEGAALEYVPDHLIPSPGARLRQRVEVTLAPTSTLIMVDAWAVGRAARGEAWLFHELDSAIVVTDRRGPLLVDRARLAGERPLDGIGGAEGSAYVGTFVAAQPALDAWGDRSQALSDAVARARLDMRFAVMPLGRGGLLARLLCPSAPVLEKAVAALWSFTRRDLLGLDPLCLRKL